MNQSRKTGLDYENGNIRTLFASIFFPTLLGMIFNALITIIDGIFVGRGVGPDGIAAVNIIAPLFMIVTGIGLMLGIGVSVVASVALSQNQPERACINLTHACIFSTALISVITAVLLCFPEESIYCLGCSLRLMPKASDYMLWLLPGLFLLAFECIGMIVIRLDGSPKFAMMCNIIPAIINIILDYYFIFPLGMGVKGAAIASSISIAVGAGMMLLYFLRLSYVIRFRITAKNFTKNIIRQIVIGSSAFITEIAMSIMMITGNYVFITHFGEDGVAAFSIACYLFPLMFMMSNAVAQSAQPIISYNYGAGKWPRTMEAFRVSIAVATVCGAVSLAGIACGARHIVSLFIDPACTAGRLAVDGLPVYTTCAIFFAINISFIGYFQSITQSGKATTFTLLRGIVILVPMFFILPAAFPGWGLWASIPASELTTLAIILITWFFHRRGQKR